MAVMRSELEREEMRRWLRTSQEKALQLLARTEGLAESVLSTQEKLLSFLDLTVRLHHFDAYNLLLIWDRYPSASYLAGYKVWEKQLPPGAYVLKREHHGKAIDLIAPFTDASRPDNHLVWYCVGVYDVSQTNLQVFPPAFDPAYIQDDRHIYFLLDALRAVLSDAFSRSVIIQPPTQVMLEVGLPGQISKNAVIVRADISLSDQLQWLTETLVQMWIREESLPPSALQLLKNCIQYCLFRIWGLDELLSTPTPISQTQLSSAEKQDLLHLLRDSVRTLNNMICSCYSAKRNEDDDISDLSDPDLEALLQQI